MRQINLQNNIINRTVTALMMTDVAGWIDTIGILRFLRNVGVFPAYMSGNTTLYRHDCTVSGRCHAWSADQQRQTAARGGSTVFFEALLLLMALVSVLLAFSDVVVLGLLALAMGCNNVALKREGSIGPRSYVTGTLVSLGSSFANAISGRAPWLEMGPSLAMWSSLALGALMGGHLASQLSDVVAILVPAVVISSIGAIIAAGWVQLDEPPLRT